jgi:hypothetical protein
MNSSRLALSVLLIGLGQTIASASTITNAPPNKVTCKVDGLAPTKVCIGAFAGMTWGTTGYYTVDDSPGVVSDYLVIKNGKKGAVYLFEPATGTPIGTNLGTLTEDTTLTFPTLLLFTGTTQTGSVQLTLTQQSSGNYPEVLVGVLNGGTTGIPEPRTLGLVGLGLVGVALSRRLFRRQLS